MNVYPTVMSELAQERGWARGSSAGAGPVIDADFAVLGRAPVPAPPRPRDEPPPAPIRPSGLDALRPAPPAPAKAFGRSGGWGFWGAGFLAAALAFWLSGGHALFWR